MNDKQFDELLSSVRDMGRHMRGEAVAGVRVQEFPEPDVKAIRERTGLSHHERLVSRADERLYAAKNAGRNRVEA